MTYPTTYFADSYFPGRYFPPLEDAEEGAQLVPRRHPTSGSSLGEAWWQQHTWSHEDDPIEWRYDDELAAITLLLAS